MTQIQSVMEWGMDQRQQYGQDNLQWYLDQPLPENMLGAVDSTETGSTAALDSLPVSSANVEATGLESNDGGGRGARSTPALPTIAEHPSRTYYALNEDRNDRSLAASTMNPVSPQYPIF